MMVGHMEEMRMLHRPPVVREPKRLVLTTVVLLVVVDLVLEVVQVLRQVARHPLHPVVVLSSVEPDPLQAVKVILTAILSSPAAPA